MAVLLVLLVVGSGGAYLLLRRHDAPSREDYVDALTSSGDRNNQLHLTNEERRCIAGVYVDVVGLETWRDKVSPDVIHDHPDDDPSDWGIDLSEQQGQTLYDGMDGCADVAAALSTMMLEDAPSPDPEADAACLEASFETAGMEEIMVSALAAGSDGLEPNEEQAGVFYDWMSGCLDLRKPLLDAMTEQGELPSDVLDCVEAKLDEDTLKRIYTTFLVEEDDEAQNSAVADELMPILATCAAG